MSVGLCSIYRNNAVPSKEASRNPGGSRVVDKAKSFHLCGHRRKGNRVAHHCYDNHPLCYVGARRRDHCLTKPISRWIMFPSTSKKQEPSSFREIQSHRRDRCCCPAFPGTMATMKNNITLASCSLPVAGKARKSRLFALPRMKSGRASPVKPLRFPSIAAVVAAVTIIGPIAVPGFEWSNVRRNSFYSLLERYASSAGCSDLEHN